MVGQKGCDKQVLGLDRLIVEFCLEVGVSVDRAQRLHTNASPAGGGKEGTPQNRNKTLPSLRFYTPGSFAFPASALILPRDGTLWPSDSRHGSYCQGFASPVAHHLGL